MDPRRKELGEFLKTVREKCAPTAFGFPAGLRRRTTGLRREEVAQLTGISPTWYTWIEQGRDVSMSPEVIHRLAESLRMDRIQRAYLFELAGKRDAQAGNAPVDILPENLTALLAEMPMPAYVLGRYWDALGWNAAAAALFAPWLGGAFTADAPANLLDFVLRHPEAPRFVVDWETRAKRLIAEFRADCSPYLDDAELQRRVLRLSQNSELFAQCWQQHEVLERQGGLREFIHPTTGLMRYVQNTLLCVEPEGLKLVVLTEVKNGLNAR